MSKIIRYHAHPQTVVSGAGQSDIKSEPGKAFFLPDKEAKAYNLEMTSDLGSSFNFLQFMREALFSITQTVDISSFGDKLGQLTNFGLKVLYQDALARLHTKQELYGDALVEINRRLSVMNSVGDNGGKVVWPEILPVNDSEELKLLQQKIDMGIISKQTAASEQGVDWEEEQKRIADEQKADNANNTNIGAMVLKGFGQGK
jgi:hypothetical protein